MKIDVVLTGFHAGKSIELAGKSFVGGRYTVQGNAVEVETQLRYLARTYQAFPVGSAELEAAQKRDEAHGIQHHAPKGEQQSGAERLRAGEFRPAGQVQETGAVPGTGPGGSASDGDSGVRSGGSGHEHSGLQPEQVAALRILLRKLDPKNDAHWTEEGLPSVEVVSQAAADQSIDRATINAVAPGFTRERAVELAAQSEEI